MRFVVDSMLGNLARWLRLLGYDTLYYKNIDDWKLIKIAKDEGRILVTRDLSLYRRARVKGVNVIYLESTSIDEELVTLANEVGIDLKFKEKNTRCPLCNTELTLIPKAEALHLIPQEIGKRYNTFWKCPKCNKVFWQGNHWKTINEVLEKAEGVLRGKKILSM